MNFDKQLEAVKATIKHDLVTGDRYIDGSLNYVKETTGKMLRPRFLLIGALFGKKMNEKRQQTIIQLAAAVESLHLATLIHDDIIDESKMRRGRDSVQHKYSKEYALYMGDYILSRCFIMLASLDVNRELEIQLAKAMNQICIGEMKQNRYRYNTSIRPLDYLKVVSRKTATLFSISLSSGAYHLKADKEIVKLLGRIGYEIGMAFQLTDDLLDYIGDELAVGKDLEKDIIQGNYNIPVLFALENDHHEDRPLHTLLEDDRHIVENRDKIIALVKANGGIDKTRELALRYNNRALALIEKLPEGEGKRILNELVPTLLKRLY